MKEKYECDNCKCENCKWMEIMQKSIAFSKLLILANYKLGQYRKMNKDYELLKFKKHNWN